MLTFTIEGEAGQVTAESFADLVDVAVRLMRDAARGSGVGFAVSRLQSSAPTIVWEPIATTEAVAIGHEFRHVVSRLEGVIFALEGDHELPDWLTDATARELYQAAEHFETSAVDAVTFVADSRKHRLTRATYRTLDRVLNEQTDAIGSVTGELITATLHGGAHVTVSDPLSGRGVSCEVSRDQLREYGQWIGLVVIASGRVKRDHRGRPRRIRAATVQLAPEGEVVTPAEAAVLYRSGPPVVEFLREQRGE